MEEKNLEEILKEYQKDHKLNNGQLKNELQALSKKLVFHKRKKIDVIDKFSFSKFICNIIKFVLATGVAIILTILSGVVLSFFIKGLFDDGGEWIYIPWILTFITGGVAISHLDIMWTRVTIIFFSISVGMFTSALFNKDLTVPIFQESIATQDGMTVPDTVALSLAIAAVLITIFETLISEFEKIK